MRNRLDKLLLEQGLAPSRERAQALILAGRVLVNQQKVEKPGASVDGDCGAADTGGRAALRQPGRIKLEAALTRLADRPQRPAAAPISAPPPADSPIACCSMARPA